MKKRIIIILLGTLLICANVYADGDLVVDGKIGIGTGNDEPNYEMQVHDSDGNGSSWIQFTTGATGTTGGSGFSLGLLGNDGYLMSSTDFIINLWGSQGWATTAFMTDGNVGIGTNQPEATLDVNGYVRLKVNSAEPASCTTSNAGSIALTSTYKMCACNGSGWISTVDGASCTWQ